MKFRCCLIFLTVLYFQKTDQLKDIFISDLNGLSELSLEKLLHVKNSLERNEEEQFENINEEEKSIATTLDVSQAQALHGRFRKGNQRGSYETSWQKKGGKKGLSTVFQITITSLAFLAFAGYLLCLLVQAIKAKQTMTTAAGTGTAAVILAPIRRRRPGVRQKREEFWPEADSETLYYALKTFSEGYATYHTIDYKYYNFTVDSFG